MTRLLKNRTLLLALLAGASVLVHLKGITAPPLDYHYHRQCNTAAIARNYSENGLEFLCPQIDWEGGYAGCSATEFPLYMWLTGLLWRIGGLAHLWGRILSALLSALTAVYLFMLLEGWMETEAAFYAGLLFSFIPLEVYFGRAIQPEAMALFCAVAGLHHWRKSLQAGRPWGHWTAAVGFAFLSIGHKLTYVHLLIPLAALSWLSLRREAFKDLPTLAAPVLILGGVYAWYKHASAGAYVVPTSPSEFLGLLHYERLAYFAQFQFLSRFPELAATYGGVILGFFGARELVWRRRQAFFAVWFLAVAAHLVAGGDYSFRHEYTSLPFAPVNAAFMGMGLFLLKAAALSPSLGPRPLDPRSRYWAVAGLLILAHSIPLHMFLRIKHWYDLTHPQLVSAREAAERVSRPDDLFLCNERGSSVFLFFLGRKGWSWDLAEAGESRIGQVEEKTRLGARFYATAKSPLFQDPEGFYAKWFFSRFPVVYDDRGLLIFRLDPTARSSGARPRAGGVGRSS
ncbi:MAG: glycosyltransferase family 39 protein [Elusimicrobia bacterium]|nr:glycosyltransferase family 39 protein [Elusimicrobiota bacterium]